jgi:hypothetical protein
MEMDREFIAVIIGVVFIENKSLIANIGFVGI